MIPVAGHSITLVCYAVHLVLDEDSSIGLNNGSKALQIAIRYA